MHTQRPELVAEALLLAHLDSVQSKEWEVRESFIVEGRYGRAYRLGMRLKGRSIEIVDGGILRGRVKRLFAGGIVGVRLNFYVRGFDVPICDRILAQKLLLDSDEERALKMACTSGPLAGVEKLDFPAPIYPPEIYSPEPPF